MTTVFGYAPASIGNVAAGFDALGAALEPLDGTLLGDVVEVALAGEPSLSVVGPYADRVPAEPESNLVRRSERLYRTALAARGVRLPPFALTLHKNLPVSSGLGSSSSSVVATLVALDAVHGAGLGREALLALAGEAEASVSGGVHLDNVAPSLLGGLRLVTPGALSIALPWPDDLYFVVVHPHLELSTAASRGVLPSAVERALAIEFAQNLAAFVHALHAGDRALLASSLRDPLAEPHRAPLVPGFREAQDAALATGALGCSLSGSGPSVFAVAEFAAAPATAAAMAGAFREYGVPCDAWTCRLDRRGARAWNA